VNDGHALRAAQISRRLDANSLRIELTASRLPNYGFNGVLQGLRSRAVWTWRDDRCEPKHRTLGATLDWSYRLLPDRERRASDAADDLKAYQAERNVCAL
jgi:predicted ATPase